MTSWIKELFRAEQRRLADDGGLRRHLVPTVLSLCLLMRVMWGLMAGLSAFPRNADHSMNVIYYGLVLGLLGLAAALLLRRPFLRKPPFRATLWGLIFVSAVVIPVGAFDALLRNGSCHQVPTFPSAASRQKLRFDFYYALGSGLVDQSQKMTVAASAMAEKKTVGHRS